MPERCEFHTWNVKDDQIECADCPATRDFSDSGVGAEGTYADEGHPLIEEKRPKPPTTEEGGKKTLTFL